MVVLIPVKTLNVFCASTASTLTVVLKAPLRIALPKYWAKRLVTQTTATILSVAKFF